MDALLRRRRKDTDSRIEDLRNRLQEAEKLCQDKASVYAIGSFGRGEASKFSDLDLFIAGLGKKDKPSLPRLDQILLMADLILAVRKLGIRDFSGDGEYLIHYTVKELVGTLGKPQDDATNTLTARLLLLLESRPLLESSVYKKIVDDVVRAYWRDYKDHKNEFIPAYLANDILRLWRTFCVNYEARTATEPPTRKAKRKLKNYKLKHSRLLTCYSGILYLLAVFAKRRTVKPEDAIQMTTLSPTNRIEWLLDQKHLNVNPRKIRAVLDAYEKFLSDTDAPEGELVKRFMDKRLSRTYIETGNKLGDSILSLVEAIGRGNRFHRLLVV